MGDEDVCWCVEKAKKSKSKSEKEKKSPKQSEKHQGSVSRRKTARRCFYHVVKIQLYDSYIFIVFMAKSTSSN
jgi:hypothetical protein